MASSTVNMLITLLFSFLPLALAIDPTTVIDSNGISLFEKIEEMERQLLNPQLLSSLVNPCFINVFSNPNEGRQTSAEWVRLVFHDAITKNIEGPGKGGLDASVSFESDRPENAGGAQFINVTIAQFNPFQSVFLSMADLIGVGLVDSLVTCDSTHRRLALRVGRTDATGPGPSGVPGPSDSLAFAQAAFTRAGFTQAEMIQSIACGHSLGGVHGKNFPDIGGPFKEDQPGFDPTNTFGRKPFGTTPDAFDANGIAEYLDGTGLKGGPLVVGLNDTENSDKRIFKSDGNVTISAMRSATSFRDTCFNVFDKLMNTVPSTVTLSDPVVIRPWIMLKSFLDLTPAGVANFTGQIAAHATTEPPATATYRYVTAGNGNTGTKTSQVGTVAPGVAFGPAPPATDSLYLGLGVIKLYNFWDLLFTNPVTSIQITSPGSTYVGAINPNIFVIPSMSFKQAGANWLVRVAIAKSISTTNSAPVVTAWSNVPQANSQAFKVVSSTGTLAFEKSLGTYNIYKTSTFSPAIPDSSTHFMVTLGTNKSAKLHGSTDFNTTCTAASVGLC